MKRDLGNDQDLEILCMLGYEETGEMEQSRKMLDFLIPHT
jgi:hypothetical protein